MSGTKGKSGGVRAPGPDKELGRPPNSATIRAGNPIRVARKSADGYEHIGTGETSIERSGADRIVRVPLEDGSTIIITVY